MFHIYTGEEQCLTRNVGLTLGLSALRTGFRNSWEKCILDYQRICKGLPRMKKTIIILSAK